MARGSSQSDFKLSSTFDQRVELPAQSGFQKLGIGRRTNLEATETVDDLMREENLFREWANEKTPSGKTQLDVVYNELENYIAGFAQQESARLMAAGNTDFKDKGAKGVFSLVQDVDGQKMQFLLPDLTVRVSRSPIEPREGMTVKKIALPLPAGLTLNENNLRVLGINRPRDLWFAYPNVRRSGEMHIKALDAE